jgi:hypothetical protein
MTDHPFAAEVEFVKRATRLPAAVAADLAVAGGVLRCGTCKREQPLGDVASHVRHGWPRCCGQTMTWVTRRMLLAREREVPEGYELVAVESEGWRLQAGGHCRRPRCAVPAVAALNRHRRVRASGLRPARTVDAWYGYCLAHMYGNWIEAGKVMCWVLREKNVSD